MLLSSVAGCPPFPQGVKHASPKKTLLLPPHRVTEVAATLPRLPTSCVLPHFFPGWSPELPAPLGTLPSASLQPSCGSRALGAAGVILKM